VPICEPLCSHTRTAVSTPLAHRLHIRITNRIALIAAVPTAAVERFKSCIRFGRRLEMNSYAEESRSISRRPMHSRDYLKLIGVPELPPHTSPFDPGYDPATLESHLEQSAHLMSSLKISMACWIIADELASRRKISAARRCDVPVVTGGGPFEIAVAQRRLAAYLDLCADMGVTRIECGEGFTDLNMEPKEVIRMISHRGLEAQFELGKKHTGPFTGQTVDFLIEQGKRWLDAGALQLVIEARESAQGVGLFDDEGKFNPDFADRFARAFGLDVLMYEAPIKSSQFTLLNHFGPAVHLCNVRLEELLRVEIYRRGLHSDAFQHENLRPRLERAEPANTGLK
jgi:phosphosulfolactate synthase